MHPVDTQRPFCKIDTSKTMCSIENVCNSYWAQSGAFPSVWWSFRWLSAWASMVPWSAIATSRGVNIAKVFDNSSRENESVLDTALMIRCLLIRTGVSYFPSSSKSVTMCIVCSSTFHSCVIDMASSFITSSSSIPKRYLVAYSSSVLRPPYLLRCHYGREQWQG